MLDMNTTTAPVRQLEAAGFTREQAEAIVDAHAGELATRADITAAIAELKADMLKVAIGMVFGIVALNATLTFAIIRIAVP